MGTIVAFLVLTWICLKIFAALAPLLLECAWLALRFIGICFLESVRLLLSVLWNAVILYLPLAFAAVRKTALFALIFWQEWRDPGAFAEDEEDDDEDDEAGRTPEQLFQDALTLLGLGPNFTQADLKRAFKRAMLQAHPDRGGSADQAVAVNVARDLINAEMGWS